MTVHSLQGLRILVVEDEYYLAMDLDDEFKAAGVMVCGPVASVAKALAVIAAEPVIDAAVIDINLGGEMGYPVADALIARSIPFVFTSGYADNEFKGRYPDVVNIEKPVDHRKLVAALAWLIEHR